MGLPLIRVEFNKRWRLLKGDFQPGSKHVVDFGDLIFDGWLSEVVQRWWLLCTDQWKISITASQNGTGEK